MMAKRNQVRKRKKPPTKPQVDVMYPATHNSRALNKARTTLTALDARINDFEKRSRSRVRKKKEPPVNRSIVRRCSSVPVKSVTFCPYVTENTDTPERLHRCGYRPCSRGGSPMPVQRRTMLNRKLNDLSCNRAEYGSPGNSIYGCYGKVPSYHADLHPNLSGPNFCSGASNSASVHSVPSFCPGCSAVPCCHHNNYTDSNNYPYQDKYSSAAPCYRDGSLTRESYGSTPVQSFYPSGSSSYLQDSMATRYGNMGSYDTNDYRFYNHYSAVKDKWRTKLDDILMKYSEYSLPPASKSVNTQSSYSMPTSSGGQLGGVSGNISQNKSTPLVLNRWADPAPTRVLKSFRSQFDSDITKQLITRYNTAPVEKAPDPGPPIYKSDAMKSLIKGSGLFDASGRQYPTLQLYTSKLFGSNTNTAVNNNTQSTSLRSDYDPPRSYKPTSTYTQDSNAYSDLVRTMSAQRTRPMSRTIPKNTRSHSWDASNYSNSRYFLKSMDYCRKALQTQREQELSLLEKYIYKNKSLEPHVDLSKFDSYSKDFTPKSIRDTSCNFNYDSVYNASRPSSGMEYNTRFTTPTLKSGHDMDTSCSNTTYRDRPTSKMDEVMKGSRDNSSVNLLGKEFSLGKHFSFSDIPCSTKLTGSTHDMTYGSGRRFDSISQMDRLDKLFESSMKTDYANKNQSRKADESDYSNDLGRTPSYHYRASSWSKEADRSGPKIFKDYSDPTKRCRSSSPCNRGYGILNRKVPEASNYANSNSYSTTDNDKKYSSSYSSSFASTTPYSYSRAFDTRSQELLRNYLGLEAMTNLRDYKSSSANAENSSFRSEQQKSSGRDEGNSVARQNPEKKYSDESCKATKSFSSTLSWNPVVRNLDYYTPGRDINSVVNNEEQRLMNVDSLIYKSTRKYPDRYNCGYEPWNVYRTVQNDTDKLPKRPASAL